MKKHRLTKGDVQGAFEKYQKKEDALIPDCINFIRTLGSQEVGIIARQKKDGFWLIVSAWGRKLFK